MYKGNDLIQVSLHIFTIFMYTYTIENKTLNSKAKNNLDAKIDADKLRCYTLNKIQIKFLSN